MNLKPKNWDKFQHYKDRCPPWIKLHRDILNDRIFASLPIASKALAPLLWLLASESKDGSFNADSEELAFRLHIASNEIADGLKPLIDKGFFVDASTMLAPRLQLAIPERETERETETEVEAKPKQSRGTRLPTDWTPTDEQIQFCRESREDLDPSSTADSFRDFWIAQPGVKGTKLDWNATWRNWVRTQRIIPNVKVSDKTSSSRPSWDRRQR
jgi:hypothetical protein